MIWIYINLETILAGDLDLLVDHFLEISRQGPLYRKEAFLILNHILLGAGGR